MEIQKYLAYQPFWIFAKIHILREINFGELECQKIVIVIIRNVSNFVFCEFVSFDRPEF